MDYYSTVLQKNRADQSNLFRSAKSLFEQEANLTFQGYHDNRILATFLCNDLGKFFVRKVELIRDELDSVVAHPSPATEIPSLCSTQFGTFTPLIEEDIKRFIEKSSKRSCNSHSMPTPLVVECLDVLLPVVSKMIDLFLKTGSIPGACKHSGCQTKAEETQL